MRSERSEGSVLVSPAIREIHKKIGTPNGCPDGLLYVFRNTGKVPSYSLAPCPLLPDYSFGPAATRALPASFPSYFTKFLMKRPARSLAFSSHSARF